MSDRIIGRKPVLEALKSRQSVQKILIQFGTHGKVIDDIRALAKRLGIPVSEMDRQKFESMADPASAQGIAAVLDSKVYVEIEDILEIAKRNGEAPFVLILDEIEDPHNLGALIRTAECAGVHGVVLPKHHSAQINETVAKTSAGASVHMPAARVANIAQTIDMLKQNGIWVIGTDSSGEKVYYEADYKGPIAVVVGNEGKGIRRLVKEKCDFFVKIPLHGKVESLNASVAGALVMFEAAKARGKSD
ncbi:MAG TPA: 23S rRNA (guanosine(2251)-2'-O)-methyltransferase RlmB [Bacteroidota bacterium]